MATNAAPLAKTGKFGDLRRRLVIEVSEALRHEGTAAIHVTHDLAEAAAMADRVITVPEAPESGPSALGRPAPPA